MYSNIQKIMDEGFTFTIPSGMELEKLGLDENISVILSPGSNLASARENAEYEQFLADVWVGIVLTLMVLVCVCCMCSCLLYHKFQQWKRSVMTARTPSNAETGNAGCAEAELPSYSIASGLPSYEEALEQLQKVKELINTGENSEKNFRVTQHSSNWVPRTPPTPVHISVTTLFHNYRRTNSNSNLEVEAKPT